jgi:phenylacetate-coenzyme A ligase PaaK-like adenylate-forming protein
LTGEFWNQELETKSWLDVTRWQAARLESTLAALQARSDFYRSRLGPSLTGKVGSLESLAGLPFLTKEDLRESQLESVIGQPFGKHQVASLNDIVQAVSSSGSTGRPVLYGLTEHDRQSWSNAAANVFFTAGIRSDDVVAHLVGLPIVAGGLPYADGFRRLGATLAWLGGLSAERILGLLTSTQATSILSTTSFATHLSDRAKDLTGNDAAALGVRKIVAGGEPGIGQPEIRDKIQRGWGTEHVREIMGLADVMAAMWAECDDQSGMHFNAQEYVVVEIVDPRNLNELQWSEGVIGEAVYTTLDREATPVIRFRSNDQILVTGLDCRCGRTSPKIRCIGRTDDMLIYRGMNVFPTAIRDVVVRRFPGVTQPYVRIWKEHESQVQFDLPIPLDVEADSALPVDRYGPLAKRIELAVREELQIRVRVSILASGSIPKGTYKTALVQTRKSIATH